MHKSVLVENQYEDLLIKNKTVTIFHNCACLRGIQRKRVAHLSPFFGREDLFYTLPIQFKTNQ
jgi:hypothetical protein